jgi:hypothetical protein
LAKKNILRGFFMEHCSEVVKVMQLDYTFERQIMLEREEAWREGWKEGWKKGWKECFLEEYRKDSQAEVIIEMGQELGWTDDAILEQLQKKLDMSHELAVGYLRRYGTTFDKK